MNLISVKSGKRAGGKKEKTEREREKKRKSEKSPIHKKTEEGKLRVK